MPPDEDEPKTNPGGKPIVPVTLLASDMTRVTDTWIRRPNGPMPDIVLWQGRTFGRERIRDPQGARRWTYVEVSCAPCVEVT